MRRVYLDSCVAVYAIEGNPELRAKIFAKLLPPNDESPCVVYTDLTRLECRVKPLADKNSALLTRYEDFFSTPGYEKYLFETSTFDLATTPRAEHRIKTPDALHLAAAICAGCSQFWTNDTQLAVATSGRIEVLVVNSHIS
ncbi:MAG: type II toxin-antitoxin system VapC family toxin [Burkholderiales bacterium]